MPELFHAISTGSHEVLRHSLFKVGGLAITPVFLFKATLFLLLLFTTSHLIQRFLLGRLFRHLHVSDAQRFALGRFATYLFILCGLFIGLQSLGVNLSSLVVFGGALGVGIGLGLQNVVSNVVAGIVLLIEQPIRIGDRIAIKETYGDVVRIAARSTWIRTNDNVVIIVPNSDFINNSVTNLTADDPTLRVHVPLGVGYGSDPEEVQRLLIETGAAHPDVLADPKPIVVFTGYGDNSINFDLLVWTASRTHMPLLLRSDLYYAIFKVFKESGIELPFPQRDLHLRSSDISLPFVAKAGESVGNDVENVEAQ